jgi:hypothetical protein
MVNCSATEPNKRPFLHNTIADDTNTSLTRMFNVENFSDFWANCHPGENDRSDNNALYGRIKVQT